MRILQAVVALATVIALTLPFAASAQDYPNRRVTLIVPFGPGGPGDLLIRTVAERLEQRWKQPVVVDYRPGAGGLIAHEYVAKAPADGYTLLQGATSFTLYHLLNKDLKFDPLKDLTIVAMTGRSSSVYMTNAQVPASNWNEFVAYAKANPGKVNYASLGRSIVMMGMELLSAQAGIKWRTRE
jgi:tripartite-type tricarboxylate transporter receptor subunit TctC